MTTDQKLTYKAILLKTSQESGLPVKQVEEALHHAFAVIRREGEVCAKIMMGPLGVVKIFRDEDGEPRRGVFLFDQVKDHAKAKAKDKEELVVENTRRPK